MYVIIDTNKLEDCVRDYIQNEAKEAIVDGKLTIAISDDCYTLADRNCFLADAYDCVGNFYTAEWDIIAFEINDEDCCDWSNVRIELKYDCHGYNYCYYADSDSIVQIVFDDTTKFEEFSKLQ